MTLKDLLMYRAEFVYTLQSFKGKSLLDWAVLWFKTSNDAFFELYGFNFNPHEYPMLYEIARKKFMDRRDADDQGTTGKL